jgi:hypothetical protein
LIALTFLGANEACQVDNYRTTRILSVDAALPATHPNQPQQPHFRCAESSDEHIPSTMKITSLAVAAFCLAARAEAFTGPQLARQSRFGVVSTVRAFGCWC